LTVSSETPVGVTAVQNFDAVNSAITIALSAVSDTVSVTNTASPVVKTAVTVANGTIPVLHTVLPVSNVVLLANNTVPVSSVSYSTNICCVSSTAPTNAVVSVISGLPAISDVATASGTAVQSVMVTQTASARMEQKTNTSNFASCFDDVSVTRNNSFKQTGVRLTPIKVTPRNILTQLTVLKQNDLEMGQPQNDNKGSLPVLTEAV